MLKLRKLHEIRHSQEGAVLPLIGLAFLALVAAVGIAVDYGRAQMVQTKLHSSLDAAGLAAASVAKSRDIETEVLKFMDANFPQGYMDAQAPSGSNYGNSYVTRINVVSNPLTSSVTIDLEGRAEVNTIFMRIFGYDSVPVEAETVVSQTRRRGFEMVMALDSTGSMRGVQDGVSRRDAMVRAANEMLDILYGPQDSFDNIFIGLVPFSHQVRIGSARRANSAWTRDAVGNQVNSNVLCINEGNEDRPENLATTATPPERGNSFFLASSVNNCNQDLPNYGPNDYSDITPMQTSKARIRTALSQIKNNGNTRIDIGAVWAWRMLSPLWQGRWNHVSAALPLSFNTPDMDKVVILLTDGFNEPRPNTVTQAQANNRLTTVCNRMKADGVIVYTITFHDIRAQALMRNCASSADHYFHASGNESIGQVFRQIADSLMNLRISK